MKKLKNMFSFLLVITVLFSVSAVTAEDTVPAAAEEAAVKYSDDYGLLKALDILTEEDFKLPSKEAVSRAEFAVYICKLGKVSVGDAKGLYNDVMKGTIEEAYIEAAVGATYFSSVNEGYFYPSYPITKTEVLMSILKIYGYPDFEKNGIDPYSQSVTRNLFKGVTSGETISREDVYRMLYQSLFEHPAKVSLGSGSFEFEIDKNETILSSVYNVEYVTDIITAAGHIGKSDGKYVLRIGDKDLLMPPNMVAANVVGRNAKCYYNKETDEIVYLQLYKNNELRLKIDDNVSYKDLVYKYGDEKKVTLKSPVVYYNDGVYTGELTEAVMAPNGANIILLDNNDDEKYEIVFISSKKDYFVRMINVQDDYFFIDYITGEMHTFENRDNLTVYNEDGEEIQFSAIEDNSVVSLARSTDGNMAKLYVSTKVVGAKVIGMYNDADGMEYIDCEGGVKYYISDYLKDAFNNSDVLKPQKGKEYDVYLNVDDKAVYINAINATKRNYGILTKAVSESFGSNASVRIFSRLDGGFKDYKLAKNVTLNGTSTKKYDKIIEALKYDGVPDASKIKGDRVVGQLVEFAVNDNGDINVIQQALKNGNTIDKASGLQCFDDYKITYSGAGWLQRAGTKGVDRYRQVGYDEKTVWRISLYDTASCITYLAPYNVDATGKFLDMAVDDEKAFEMSRMGAGGTYDVVTYKDRSDTEVLCAAVRKTPSGAAEVPTSWNTGMVDKLSNGLNSEDSPVTMLTVNGTTYELEANFNVESLKIFNWNKEEVGRHKLKVGDIINFIVNSANVIYQIEPLYDGTERKFLCNKLCAAYGKDPKYAGTDVYFQTYGRTNTAGEANMTAYHLYKQESGFMFAAPRNKNNVGIFSPYTFDDKIDPIYILHRPGKMRYFDGEKTRAGTVNDLIGFKDSPENYVDIVVDDYYSIARIMYIYKSKP